MSILIKHMAMPKGCIYANDKDQTEYCPLLNHDDVPFCQYIENEPEIAIGIDERPVYCPLSDVSPCQDTVSRQAAIDALVKRADEVSKTIQEGADFPDMNWIAGMAHAVGIVKALPPVQPDIIRCKDCKHKGTKNCVANVWTNVWGAILGVTVKDDFYCGLAERRTDEGD